MVSKRLDLSFGIFARWGEKYSCFSSSDDLFIIRRPFHHQLKSAISK
ncbi:hypothetical protein NEIMUCOT_03547 [Neisseria mucosa ATCC 25996]|uniref:Uncharacterized protein n=1 Tax=Neisseria mucosa (strain ATCC 25996 / DSM 4631 / NCTC 10774 / M26) TaxID=546266 RepID=D2ZSG5_NEIM2|nr:hypothetical protein NEIMUCOT_03547 [Neisseria mucosa ATCC 25996]